MGSSQNSDFPSQENDGRIAHAKCAYFCVLSVLFIEYPIVPPTTAPPNTIIGLPVKAATAAPEAAPTPVFIFRVLDAQAAKPQVKNRINKPIKIFFIK